MLVMTLHEWFDESIEKIFWHDHKDVREIILNRNNEGIVLITKKDAIALAKEFGLIVFNGDDQL